MSTDYVATELHQTNAAARPVLRLLARCWAALLEWRERAKERAELRKLTGSELRDFGISGCDIEYVAANRSADPRGIRSGG